MINAVTIVINMFSIMFIFLWKRYLEIKSIPNIITMVIKIFNFIPNPYSINPPPDDFSSKFSKSKSINAWDAIAVVIMHINVIHFIITPIMIGIT